MDLVEIVPNISEGKNRDLVREVATSAESVEGAALLDTHMDVSHHRSVLTFVARPEAAVALGLELMSRCIERIDLRRHEGVHPRIGALDVLPFVALGRVSSDTAIGLARNCGSRLAARFDIPVFLYGAASTRRPTLQLSTLRRRGGFESLGSRLETGELATDFGPAKPHPTAGAVAVGARGFLIAYNVNLSTRDLSAARQIASRVRAASGGLPGLQALGFRLAHRDRVQVSMNLTDFRRTSLLQAFTAVTAEASSLGVAVESSELVGLVPQAACFEAMETRLMLEHPPRVLEELIRARAT